MQNSKLSQLVKNFTAKLTYRQSVMLAALCCALLAALIIFFPAGGGEQQVAQEQPSAPVEQKAKVVKAAIDIPDRTFIKEEMLKVEEVAVETVPDGAITEINDLIGKPTSTNILKGDVITDKKYYKDLKALGFAGIIPSDCRAMTVPISNVTAVAGFLNPGDYVDVMLVETNGEGLSKGELLLQNVLLLAINRNGTKPDPNAPPPQPQDNQNDKDKKEGEQQPQGDGINASLDDMNMATLALTPPEALELAAKSQHGTIYLAMRPIRPSDTFVTDTEFREAKEIPAAAPQADNSREEAMMNEYIAALNRIADNNAAQSQAPAPTYIPQMPAQSSPSAIAPQESTQTVEVIRGTERTTEGVK